MGFQGLSYFPLYEQLHAVFAWASSAHQQSLPQSHARAAPAAPEVEVEALPRGQGVALPLLSETLFWVFCLVFGWYMF